MNDSVYSKIIENLKNRVKVRFFNKIRDYKNI